MIISWFHLVILCFTGAFINFCGEATRIKKELGSSFLGFANRDQAGGEDAQRINHRNVLSQKFFIKKRQFGAGGEHYVRAAFV